MNYLAHLYLAKPNADSYFGNLLGDFRKGVDITPLPNTVLYGLKNHYFVDKFTDNHPLIKQAKRLFSKEKQRFAGIAVDVLFDYFLIKHWDSFSDMSFAEFKQQSYARLTSRIAHMPYRMQTVSRQIIQHDWFGSYAELEGIGVALDNIARRIRFQNQFNNSLQDIQVHYTEFEHLFLAFFPQLTYQVQQFGPEPGIELSALEKLSHKNSISR
ncbi:ACP phosphodiesterase [Catenovulum sp. 2E275]|uniref:acyl carrier protein phosphodiesterase n=1 Tax=Catenovulum sp. 2E275 TaxID=2980497 RepID=UPI0021CFA76F|nr:ACP phosphodiesterase [Catenovulum sp. 2E275]MCU4674174.1 ACP phosphodiesterase [Catenovulum sp. 2E275]